ncbi:MAG: cell division protein ZapE [Pseudomonadota bacterium]
MDGQSVLDIYDARVEAGDLHRDAAQEALLARLDGVADALTVAPAGGLRGLFAKRPEAPKGLYVWGGVGRGKSMVMDLFFEAAPVDGKRRVHFHAFMQDVQAGLDAARKDGAQDALVPVADSIAKGLQLLCFDEVQITDIADAMIVGRLFERLMDAGVVIVATSNRPPRDLYKDGLNRDLFLPFIDLLETRLEVWEMASETDYRQTKIGDETTYYWPVDHAARTAADRIWAELGGTPKTEGLTLRVKGRDVEITQYINGVSRSRFYALCGKPLGPADYLAIAEVTRVMILDDIPRLSSENFNEARRFVTLIDALYEARVRLVASAADRPEALYLEGEGTFEFERTASRLREMTGGAFGAG